VGVAISASSATRTLAHPRRAHRRASVDHRTGLPDALNAPRIVRKSRTYRASKEFTATTP
jgi:hypothetical protein